MNLSDRVIVITGASRGLGEAFARRLAAEGARLALGSRHGHTLGLVAETLRNEGAEVMTRHLDLSDAASIDRFIGAIWDSYGQIDGLINNAGVLSGPRLPLVDTPPEAWEAVLRVNLTGVFLMCRAVLPFLRRQGRGRIVNLTSSVGLHARSGWGAYSISKFGVEGLTQLVHEEHHAEGIDCLAFNPGGTATAMRAAAYPDEDPSTLPSPLRIAEAMVLMFTQPERFPSGGRYNAREVLGIG